MRNRWWVGLSLAAAAVALAACARNGSPAASATSHPVEPVRPQIGVGTHSVRAMTTSKGTVLVSDGLTLYWFAKDTASQSNCTGSCATSWPPLEGTAVAAPGTSLPHGFGTISLQNGQTQVTYDGHPLYTYRGDKAAGQVTGNGLSLSGGLWWAITPSGTQLAASTPPGTDG